MLEKQFEPIKFTFDLRFEMRGQGTAIAGLKFFQPVAPIAAETAMARNIPSVVPSGCIVSTVVRTAHHALMALM